VVREVFVFELFLNCILVKLAGLTIGTLEAYRWHILRHPGALEPTRVASIGQVGLHSKTEITQLGVG